MIIDKLSNAKLYYGLEPLFEKGLKFLQETDLAALESGKHPIEEDDLFVNIKRYDSLPFEKCKLETHKKYADIQFAVSGKEHLGYAPLNGDLKLVESNDEKDVYFYSGHCDPVILGGDLFVIVLPDDAHMPERAIGDAPQPVVKAIVKVRV